MLWLFGHIIDQHYLRHKMFFVFHNGFAKLPSVASKLDGDSHITKLSQAPKSE
jgi:hypothetical protein